MGGGWWGIEGALVVSLVSHQYVQVVAAVILLSHPQRQHLLVQEQPAQVLLAGLPLLLQLPLAQSLLLELPLLGALLTERERDLRFKALKQANIKLSRVGVDIVRSGPPSGGSHTLTAYFRISYTLSGAGEVAVAVSSANVSDAASAAG